jgi:hypothetical protein
VLYSVNSQGKGLVLYSVNRKGTVVIQCEPHSINIKNMITKYWVVHLKVAPVCTFCY